MLGAGAVTVERVSGVKEFSRTKPILLVEKIKAKRKGHEYSENADSA